MDYDATQSRGEAFGKNNVVAEVSTISGDLRAISPEQLEMAKASMQAIVADHLPGTEATLTFRDSYPPLAPTDGNYKLLSMYDEVSQDLGLGPVGPVDPRNAGAADVSFTAGLVDMAIDGMGLGGADDHTVDETGDLWTLPIQTKRAAVLMYRLGSKTPTTRSRRAFLEPILDRENPSRLFTRLFPRFFSRQTLAQCHWHCSRCRD